MTRASDRIRGRIKNSAPVRESDPRRWRVVSLLLGLSLAVALPVLFSITQQESYLRARRSIEQLHGEKSALDQQYLRLRIEIASLQSLDLVAKSAANALGLVPPQAGIRILAPAGASRATVAALGATLPSVAFSPAGVASPVAAAMAGAGRPGGRLAAASVAGVSGAAGRGDDAGGAAGSRVRR